MPLSIIDDLRARELIFQVAGEDTLPAHLSSGMRTLYCGFDPTADSLHIGHLVPLLALRRFQQAGHRPIALVGGATGLIGDPSFKAQERQLNSPDQVAGWVDKIRAQVSRFVDFDRGSNAALVANNLDWTAGLDVLTFLRDIGKHFSINAMIQKESVKQRLQREGAGISFTEFAYTILQSFDFAELANRYDCSLQIGGSDQWGNITGGIDLTRRLYGKQVFGLTLPLVTKSDGTKFGKTESGAVWLDPARTSPYRFYQFWLGTADADVHRFLRYFTFLPIEQITEIEREDRARHQGRPEGQAVLAAEMTRLVHGQSGFDAAQRITEALFAGDEAALSDTDFEQLRLDGMPATQLSGQDLAQGSLTQLLTTSGVVESGKQAKDALQRGAVSINGVQLGLEDNLKLAQCFAGARARHGKYYVLRLGKKRHHLFFYM
jgi:tyrosyl-tRNA synthetase